MSATNPSTPPATEQPKTVEAIRKDAYADGKVTVPELRAIANQTLVDGVTKEEKRDFEADMKKAMADNPDPASRAEIIGISQMIMSNTELIKKFMYFVALVFAILVLYSVFNNGQLMALIMALLNGGVP